MKVKLRSNEMSAADATDATLKMLPMSSNAHLKRNAEGRVEFDENGYAEIVTTNPRFVKFAVINQGYVSRVIE